jgi:hypothetical protein
LAGEITSDGVESSWNGQQPARSAPVLRSSTPAASASEASDTSLFSRSIRSSGTRATRPPEKLLDLHITQTDMAEYA